MAAPSVEALASQAKKLVATLAADPDAASEHAEFLAEACARLQQNNRRLKTYIATLDAQSAHEAMHGGFLGLGCNDKKLIAVTCTRTKAQLERTAKRYAELYNAVLRDDVISETGGHYGKLLKYALAPPELFFADMIDWATEGLGCSETALIELFVTKSHAEIVAGKERWEALHDRSLVDHLDEELTEEYKHLQALIFKLLKGGRDEGNETDEEKAIEQAEKLHEECSKSFMFADFKEQVAIEIIGSNNVAQNMLLAKVYEEKYDKSLAEALTRSPKKKLVTALQGLLLPTPAFIASRLKHAMESWGTDERTLVRLLAGLDGSQMASVAQAYEQKYSTPLVHALRESVSGDFKRAACAWVTAMQDPSAGLEGTTEREMEEVGDDPAELLKMLDALLAEHGSLIGFMTKLDAETLREACKGFGTDDTRLIRVLTSRSKKHLARTSAAYWAAYDQGLEDLIEEECGGWYAYLATYLVLPETEADARLLSLAMDGLGSDKRALVEFLCARPPARVRAAKAVWEGRNDASLIDRLVGELGGDFEELALTMLKGPRLAEDADDEALDEAEAAENAATLYEALQGGRSADRARVFIEILCTHSPVHNKAIGAAFEDAYNHSLAGAIKKRFRREMADGLTALMSPQADWYAARLKAAFKGWGASNRTVCRVLGSLDKSEAMEVAAAYEKKYAKPLRCKIVQECSGNYRRLAIGWITNPDELEEAAEIPPMPTTEEVEAEAAEVEEVDEEEEAWDELEDEEEPEEPEEPAQERAPEEEEAPPPPAPRPPPPTVVPTVIYTPVIVQVPYTVYSGFPGYYGVAAPPPPTVYFD